MSGKNDWRAVVTRAQVAGESGGMPRIPAILVAKEFDWGGGGGGTGHISSLTSLHGASCVTRPFLTELAESADEVKNCARG